MEICLILFEYVFADLVDILVLLGMTNRSLLQLSPLDSIDHVVISLFKHLQKYYHFLIFKQKVFANSKIKQITIC